MSQDKAASHTDHIYLFSKEIKAYNADENKTGLSKSVMSDGQPDNNTEMPKLMLEYFISISYDSFLIPGDPAWDLHDPMEHAPYFFFLK